MSRIKELREERAKAISAARTINDSAAAEKRALTDEESAEYDKRWADVERLGGEITREENLAEEERSLAQAAESEGAANRGGGDGGEGDENRTGPCGSEEYRNAFRSFLRVGDRHITQEETRALSVGSDTQAGYLVAPEQFVNDLIQDLDNEVFIRRHATVHSVPMAQKLGVPTLDSDPADADWTAEILTGSEDSDMAIGKRQLEPHPLAKRIKVSNPLLRMATIGAESLVRGRLAYKFGVTEESAFLIGSGSAQPLGIYTASNDGISTGRDVSTDNTTTAITVDGLKNAKYSIKGGYWPNLRWNFHRDAVKMISKLKDGQGQYLWQDSIREGEPDRLLSFPVDMSEYTPNTFTTGLYVGCLGDYSHYWIADALDMQIQRLNELYAETNQVGFIGRKETDGMPTLEEAFARVTLS